MNTIGKGATNSVVKEVLVTTIDPIGEMIEGAVMIGLTGTYTQNNKSYLFQALIFFFHFCVCVCVWTGVGPIIVNIDRVTDFRRTEADRQWNECETIGPAMIGLVMVVDYV